MIKQFPRSRDFIVDGKLTERALKLIQLLVQLDILEGAGSPETVVEAKVRTLYMDTAGSAGSIMYVKKLADISGDRTKGWILI